MQLAEHFGIMIVAHSKTNIINSNHKIHKTTVMGKTTIIMNKTITITINTKISNSDIN